jgi:hypothetical protein
VRPQFAEAICGKPTYWLSPGDRFYPEHALPVCARCNRIEEARKEGTP